MASLKFDVGLVEDGKVKFMLGRGIGIREAIEIQRVHNLAASFSGRLIAVVLQAGSHDAPDFTDEEDDSEATAAPERAADAKSRVVVMTGDGKTRILPHSFTREEAEAVAEACRSAEQVDVVDDSPAAPTDRGYDLDGNAYEARKIAFHTAFEEHWEQVGKSIDMIEDACSLGIVAKSLKDLCESLGAYESDFLEGFHGSVDDRALIAALGYDA